MDESIELEKLKLMGIFINEKKMRILAAILRAQSRVGDAITFNELKSQLEEDESENIVADSLVYRLLIQLEKEGYVTVDRSRYRHSYSSGLAKIHASLKEAALTTRKNIDNKIAEMESEMESLSNLDISDFARSTLKLLTGRTHKIKSESALGKEGFENLLSDKIFSDCSRHDSIRIAMNAFIEDDDIQTTCFKFLHTYSKTKFKIRVLFTQVLTENQKENAVDQLKKIKSNGGNVRFQVCREPSRLQSFISRNTDGIMLIPSDFPHVSVWIPRILNSKLVNDTITSFDLEFSTGSDILGEISL